MGEGAHNDCGAVIPTVRWALIVSFIICPPRGSIQPASQPLLYYSRMGNLYVKALGVGVGVRGGGTVAVRVVEQWQSLIQEVEPIKSGAQEIKRWLLRSSLPSAAPAAIVGVNATAAEEGAGGCQHWFCCFDCHWRWDDGNKHQHCTAAFEEGGRRMQPRKREDWEL